MVNRISLLQVFLVELSSLPETLSHTRYLIHDPYGLNKGCGSKLQVGFWVPQKTPEEGQRTHRLKHCEYNNKDEDNSPKTLNVKKI